MDKVLFLAPIFYASLTIYWQYDQMCEHQDRLFYANLQTIGDMARCLSKKSPKFRKSCPNGHECVDVLANPVRHAALAKSKELSDSNLAVKRGRKDYKK